MTISNQSQPGWLTDEKWAAFLVEVEEQTAALVMNCTGGHPERASVEQRAGARTATFTAMFSKYRAIESERLERQGQVRVEHILCVDKAFADALEERKREKQAADARTSVALRNMLVTQEGLVQAMAQVDVGATTSRQKVTRSKTSCTEPLPNAPVMINNATIACFHDLNANEPYVTHKHDLSQCDYYDKLVLLKRTTLGATGWAREFQRLAFHEVCKADLFKKLPADVIRNIVSMVHDD